MVNPPRPMGHVFGDAMTSLAHTWRALVAPALALSAIASLCTVLVFRVTGGSALLVVVVNSPERLTHLPDEVVRAMARPYLQAIVITAALQVSAAVLVALISHRLTLAQVTGSKISRRVVWGDAARRYVIGLGASLVVLLTVVVLVGVGLSLWLAPIQSVGTPNVSSVLVAALLFGALIAPGIWIAVSGSMTTSAAALEDFGLVRTIRRSFELVRGRWMATAGFLFLVAFLGSVSTALIQFVAIPLVSVGAGGSSLTVVSVLGVITQGLLVAAVAVMCTHWYLDLRARDDGPVSSRPG